jgi:hypothetical protein
MSTLCTGMALAPVAGAENASASTCPTASAVMGHHWRTLCVVSTARPAASSVRQATTHAGQRYIAALRCVRRPGVMHNERLRAPQNLQPHRGATISGSGRSPVNQIGLGTLS